MRSLESLRTIQLPFQQASLWPTHAQALDFERCRAQNDYLWQRPDQLRYEQFFDEVYDVDAWNLLDTLNEDDAFGVITFKVDDKTVSRDLLDSIFDISYLSNKLGWKQDQAVNVIDIGAGYGRIAHRLCEAMPNAQVWCLDAIPESTWICQQYLAYRGCTRGHIVPFDTLPEAIDNIKFDVAIAIHSWSECSEDTVNWWASFLKKQGVPSILFVGGIITTWGDAIPITSILANHGYQPRSTTHGGIDVCTYIWFEQTE